jgi:hypothetical protein
VEPGPTVLAPVAKNSSMPCRQLTLVLNTRKLLRPLFSFASSCNHNGVLAFSPARSRRVAIPWLSVRSHGDGIIVQFVYKVVALCPVFRRSIHGRKSEPRAILQQSLDDPSRDLLYIRVLLLCTKVLRRAYGSYVRHIL